MIIRLLVTRRKKRVDLRWVGKGQGYTTLLNAYCQKNRVTEWMKKDIKNDVFACMNIFQNENVQEDIEDFLLKLDFVRAAMNHKVD